MNEFFISPSILSADFAKMGEDIKRITEGGADMIHCDVMDGTFVPNISFGPKMIADIRSYTSLPLDVHLMVNRPERYIDVYAKAGADYIVVHYEACGTLVDTLKKIRKLGKKSGLVISPDTPAEVVYDYLPLTDLILVMSVYPGFSGQKFLPSSLEKLEKISAKIKESGLNIRLQIDGGINEETVKLVKKAGADTVVAGSSVFGASDVAEAIKKLRDAQ
ncbi:MAG: ribulose-phosphate 3-epimerase [Clostridia bacterium]|nr:ribulose-phosphate 3-epimerase [Clostridia bacterium]